MNGKTGTKRNGTTRSARFAVGGLTSRLPGFRRVPLAADVLPGDRFEARGYRASEAMRSAPESALVPGDTVVYLGIMGCQAVVRCVRTKMELSIWEGHFEEAFEDVRGARRRGLEGRVCAAWSRRIERQDAREDSALREALELARAARSAVRRAVVRAL